MEDRSFGYIILKNKVWKQVLYKNVQMNAWVVYEGKNKKDCVNWLKERENKNAKKNR